VHPSCPTAMMLLSSALSVALHPAAHRTTAHRHVSQAVAGADHHATVCFIRHGESEWNAAKRFTGWTDIDLTRVGREEAAAAGEALYDNDLIFDLAFTSALKRAQDTLAIALHAAGQHSVPQMRHWRLNERHYGLLQGRSKPDCVDQYGVEQVKLWRNSFSTPPPLAPLTSPAFPGNDPKYANIPSELLPRGECLSDTFDRCKPTWDEHVVPALRDGKRVLIVAHGHSIRALVKHLEGISDDDIEALRIPNGIPLVYHLDETLQPVGTHVDLAAGRELRGTFLGDKEKVAAADWSPGSQPQEAVAVGWS